MGQSQSLPVAENSVAGSTNTNPLNQLEVAAVTIQLRALQSKVQKSINDLVQIKTDESAILQAQYKATKQAIQGILIMENIADPTSLANSLQSIQGTVRKYDETRDGIIRDYSSKNSDFFSRIWNEFQYYCMMVLYIVGPVFAAIVSANVFFKEAFILKLFYIFWGTLWYPLTIFYGCFNPPAWRGIIPLVGSDSPSFFEFWAYQNTLDLDIEEKTKLLLRLICMGVFALFVYVFFITSGPGIPTPTA